MQESICAQCHQSLRSDDAFCRSCGTRCKAQAAIGQTAGSIPKKSRSRNRFIRGMNHPLFVPFCVTVLLVVPFIAYNGYYRLKAVRRPYIDEIYEGIPSSEKENASQKPEADALKQPPAAAKNTAAIPASPTVEQSVPAQDTSEDKPAPDPFAYTPRKPEVDPNRITVVDPPTNSETDEEVLSREVIVYSDLLTEMARMYHEDEDTRACESMKAKTEKQYRKVIRLPEFDANYEEANSIADKEGNDITWSDGTPVRFIIPKS